MPMYMNIVRIALPSWIFEDAAKLTAINKFYMYQSNGAGIKFLQLGRTENIGIERESQSMY